MITLTSDFGTPYPAAMKGVFLQHTDARLVDIGHDFPRQDVRTTAFWLREVLPYFPPAVHLVVVDPGVGTDRAALVVRARRPRPRRTGQRRPAARRPRIRRHRPRSVPNRGRRPGQRDVPRTRRVRARRRPRSRSGRGRARNARRCRPDGRVRGPPLSRPDRSGRVRDRRTPRGGRLRERHHERSRASS